MSGENFPDHGTVELASNGSFTYTPDPDYSGADTFTFTVDDGQGGTDTATVTVNVMPVPDLPALSVAAASGVEDTTIPLTIAAAVAGTEGVASVTVSDVPDGATLSAGTDQGDGTWLLAPDDLDGLTITPPANSSTDFSLRVTATSTDDGVTSAVLAVAVAAVADMPMLAVSDIDIGGGGLPTDDVLRGTRGEDVLVGGAGDDTLKGEGGEDVLHGGVGDDLLLGGKGEDVFVFETNSGSDTITDYQRGETLRFEGEGFTEEGFSIDQNGSDAVITFGGQDVEVTVNDVDLSELSYTVTQETDGVTVVFDDFG